ncbi:ParB/RepB/Spo0J family partition protein [Herbaspirillum sp. SJZ107]|uniref:ParB/RepB/Spo0J family partition protein n=1 Tax=Herbaspirillum sp. SJZ107 TaxID=2572881 RepID=UPI0011538334|nr:ParB/RepB/Spo0J family partition protein [Herbaspirillum sp. SJZ107]TQK07836.1 ParB family chromosome partitioning protein [Herbaspirillum sp. SJZ107]
MTTRMNLMGLADVANVQLAAKGKPLSIALDDIIPDPNNPRNADDDGKPDAMVAQEELDADVGARGVKTPISVRPHPALPGKYIINYGHRRYKSAQRNGFASIPAFVDEQFDTYDQVNENELRVGLTTRARALFIKSRLDAGESKVEITERLRKKNQTFVTEHLAIIDAPDCVNLAYAAGVTSARTLYDLRQAWEAFPVQIDDWCREAPHITRETIKQTLERLRHDEAGASAADSSLLEASVHHREESACPGLASLPDAASSDDGDNAGSGKSAQDGSALVRPAFSDSRRVPQPAAEAKLRHDEVGSSAGKREDNAASSTAASTVGHIGVQYRGRQAWILVGATVPIVFEADGAPTMVSIAELVFDR